uniref:Importin subunit alpha n=2 Tax=Dunaliella tertiolecta TaxID=3047 RepID=A0A7S3QSF1_DUNTE|mmetsp:Transcript_18123/g.50775  ORF Transcript_18123/g.50775 Transcript_18123/m.50775 type:complete len:594 (-) Transcript_18123:45-1826(-)
MGCGASKAAEVLPGQAADNVERKEHAIAAENGTDVANAPGGRQLNKVSSQLGGKTVQNSFVVQKTRSRNKRATEEALGDSIPTKVERDPNWDFKEEEPLNKDAANAFQLPAESVVVAEPGMQGPAISGPSFKMARGAQAQILADLKSKGQMQDVPANKEKLSSSDPDVVMEGVIYFREQLSVVNPPVSAVRSSGILPTLVKLLGEVHNSKLQYEVAWILTNICSAEHEDCAAVVDQNAIPIFVSMLRNCEETDVLEQAIWALGNIAADCTELQRAVLDEEVVFPLLECMERHMAHPSVLRHCAWLLSNLCRPKPQEDVLLDTIPMACRIIASSSDQEAITHACWALKYLTGAPHGLDVLSEVPELEATLSKLVAWIEEATSILTIPSLRTVVNLCSGSSRNMQLIVDAGALSAMLACLDKCDRLSLKKDAVWALSNVAAGTCSQVEAMARAGAFPKIIALLHGNEEALKRECAFTLANPWASNVGISPDVADLLIKDGVLKELVDLLDLSVDTSIVKVAIQGLQEATKRGQQMMRDEANKQMAEGQEEPNVSNRIAEVIKEHGALDKLHELLASTEEEVYFKANGLKNILAFL